MFEFISIIVILFNTGIFFSTLCAIHLAHKIMKNRTIKNTKEKINIIIITFINLRSAGSWRELTHVLQNLTG